MDYNGIYWIFELFDEIEEPTLVERAQTFSLLMAEVENWSSQSKRTSTDIE